MNTNRRTVLKKMGILGGAIFATPISMHAAPGNNGSYKFDVGLASYSTRNFSLDETIEMCQRMGITSLTIKSMHLPMDSSDAKIKSTISKVEDAGITPFAGSVIYMKTEQEVDNAFRYTAAAGMPMIVGVPNYELLDYVEEKIKAYDIKVAIHNHGPDDLPYATPEEVLERIGGRDERFGMCMDIGHVIRTGNDPVASVKKVGHKLFDMHVWDVSEASKQGHAVPGGQGIVDFPALLKALVDIDYSNNLHVEYASEGDDPLPAIAQTVGFIRGVMAGMKRA